VSRVFADTSGFLAYLVPTDREHASAVEAFRRLGLRKAALVTTSYVLCETYALLLRRHGLERALAFRDDLEPLLKVVWVDAALHGRALDLLAARRKPRLSLVDAASLVLMRESAIDEAFAYDPDFDDEGFRRP